VIVYHRPGDKAVEQESISQCADLTSDAIWIDVCAPTQEEELALESSLGIEVPTPEEMRALELSSRLYKKGDVLYMTATVMTNAHIARPESSAITFMLMPQRLVTLRYQTPQAFQTFQALRESEPEDYRTGHDILAGLVDAVIERIADILENVGAALDDISREVFEAETETVRSSVGVHSGRAARRDYVGTLRRIGLNSDLVSRGRESLLSFSRLIAFYREVHKETAAAHEALLHFKTLNADLTSLSDHATFLAGKVGFLLDATLGMINNEQNRIIKIVSLAAVVFLPPTLVASLYGMNFKYMPELEWYLGYPFALLLMVISAVLPYLIFKAKRWL
jgi:magnesium transporter